MKKYFIGMIILSVMLMMNSQEIQAKGDNGKVGIKQENINKGKKHPEAHINKGNIQKPNTSSNVGANKRLEGKEKAIQRRLDGKEKAIERRMEGKENAIQRRTENGANIGHRGHRGHGRYKKNLNNSNIQQRHTNRGDINSQKNLENNLKQEKNKKYIKQNGVKNKPTKISK